MEDQISRTIEESIKVLKDTWSKDLTEIRSMLQELVGNLPTIKPTVVEFQLFCGENPELWISQAERYFDFYEITENHKLSLASCYLEGTAFQWYQWLFQNKQLADLKYFTEKVLIHFRKCHLESAEDSLSNLQQWSNITNSSLLQNCEEKSERKSKIDVHKVFDERLTCYCPTVFAETQPDTPIEMAGEEATNIESIAVQLFTGHTQRELSERYVNALYLDCGSNEQQIHEIEILEGEIPVDEVIPDVECGKYYGGEEYDEGVLLVVSVTQIVFSMKFYSPCKGCSTIVMDEFEEILKTSTCHIANNFIDQRLLTQFQFKLGATTCVVPVHGIASNLCVWDPGISSEFLILTGSNKNVEAHALLEEISKRRSCLLVNSYDSKIIETEIDVVDISYILLHADKSDTNDSPVKGSNRTWFCLHPTTPDLALVLLEPLSSYSTITGGQDFSVGYSYNSSKSLYIAGDVHLLVLHASIDFKHEDFVVYFKFVWPYVFCNDLGYCIHFVLVQDLLSYSSNVKDIEQAHPCVNDDQRSSHKSLFLRHIDIVYFYYVVGSAQRPDSTFFLLASTELVFTTGFLIERDFHVLQVKSRESYNADGILVSAPYADVHENAKASLVNDSKLPWTYHTLCHVYQCDFCCREAVLKEINCSTPWSPLSSFISTHNEWCVAVCYMEKTGMKLPCSFTDGFLSSKLVEQMVVPMIGFKTSGSFSLSVHLNNDPIRANEEMLAIPGSSSLFGICYMPPEVVIENLPVPLPSLLYHMNMNLHKTNVFVLNFSEKLFYENVIFPSLVWLYSNLEDKVLISGGSIVMNTVAKAVGPEAKPQRGPRFRQPNTNFS